MSRQARAAAPMGRWSAWRYNWLAKHKQRRALERARRHAYGALLDLGCGARPWERLFRDQVTRVLGLDLPRTLDLAGTKPDLYASADAVPLRGGSVDTVLAMAMLSYVPDPASVFREAHRVLGPGGILIAEFVQMAPVERLHRGYPDYYRYTRQGAELMLGRAGFEVVEVIPIGGLMARVGLSTIAALNRVNRGPTRVLTEIPVRLGYLTIQLFFEALDRVFFDPREVLAHLVVARRNRAPSGA